MNGHCIVFITNCTLSLLKTMSNLQSCNKLAPCLKIAAFHFLIGILLKKVINFVLLEHIEVKKILDIAVLFLGGFLSVI